MRLTRRGWAVLGVVGLTYLAAWAAGERALNAVAAPLLAALAVGALLVWRAEEPALSYGSVPAGFPDEERTLTLSVTGGGLVTLRQQLPGGLAAEAVDAAVTPPYDLERSVALAARGVYRLDPPRVRQQDPLGLVSVPVTVESTCEVVVYPRVYDVGDGELARAFAADDAAERQAFDRLREYVPGDPLRNVHWKSSAKRDDFFVVEFSPDRRDETVTVAADAAVGHADEMAAAVATLALGALDAGRSVEVTVPGDHVPAGRGEAHRETLLRRLAAADSGTVPAETHGEVDVSIHADAEGTTVRLGDHTERFENLRTSVGGPGPSPEVRA